jgi:hypothetical protein
MIPRAGIYIGSKHMVGRLMELGVGPRKTKVVKPCGNVPNNLLRHYWRGVVDGDGHVSKRTDVHSASISLSGNKYMAEGFREFVSSFTGSKARVRKGTRSHVIHFGGTNLVQKIVRMLYVGSTLYLTRKYNSAQEISDMKCYWRRLHH